jgi:hypothetical protein
MIVAFDVVARQVFSALGIALFLGFAWAWVTQLWLGRGGR